MDPCEDGDWVCQIGEYIGNILANSREVSLNIDVGMFSEEARKGKPREMQIAADAMILDAKRQGEAVERLYTGLGYLPGGDVAQDLYEGNYGSAVLSAGLEFIPFSKAGKIAAKGGKHAGFLKNYIDLPTTSVLKGIESYSDHILKHMDYIENPTTKVPHWLTLRPGHRERLIHGWRQEIVTAEEQINILTDILKNR